MLDRFIKFSNKSCDNFANETYFLAQVIVGMKNSKVNWLFWQSFMKPVKKGPKGYTSDFQSTREKTLKFSEDVTRVVMDWLWRDSKEEKTKKELEMYFVVFHVLLFFLEAATALQCYQCKSPVIRIWSSTDLEPMQISTNYLPKITHRMSWIVQHGANYPPMLVEKHPVIFTNIQ